MARKGQIENNKKRKDLIAKFLPRRNELKAICKNRSLSLDERLQAQALLSKMSRNSSPVRYRNRCALTGRSRGYIRLFGLSRNVVRERASMGELPGVLKAN